MHWLDSFWWWIEVHTGTVRESGPYYGWWSGFGSDLTEVASFLSALYLVYRHTNCHVNKCPRVSRHEYDMDGAKVKLCRVHHPDIDESKKLTADAIRRHHERKKTESE